MADISDRLSLSTCWCSARHNDGYEMVEEMLSLGFKRIELSHGVRLSLVAGILRAVEEGIVEISSVHNFCPLPGSVQHAAPNLYQPSALDSREQSLWHRYSIQTLDFARKVGADRVVMHSGRVSFFFASAEARLDRWVDASEISAHELSESPEFVQRRDKAMKAIRRVAKKAIPRIRENYLQLLPEVKQRGLKLCLENRESMEEMPIDADYDDFLASLDEPEHAAYWHDTGHAQIKHQLGLIDHRAHLEKMSPRLAGFHLHDVSESGRDHQVPGTGTIDFKMISEFVRPEHTLVLELSPRLKLDQVLASRDYILEALG
ncbi:TIM barrel protein [Coraliomargarita sp. SDUM461004]|uniref:TIM barrel protein n=1 Tax=Thalassobacterium sedimentorum TaxID=3041258 RepID=A0ABU1AHC9_9BACT|nr:TIM barrel protein [Coraliomargarita sp. SDUM461004]MDQ8194225.1 TIM barrel protein [Coraliomargarita sp. SDUM461004]